MADRTSAGVFGDMFAFIAGDKTKEEMVEYLWKSQWGYDFTVDQMGADDALIKLGLAKECACGGTYYKGDDVSYHTEDQCDAEAFE